MAGAVEETVAYLRICGGGMIFVAAYNGISGIFRGLGNSRVPLLFVFLACCINVVLDLCLVWGAHLGAAGAAWATILAASALASSSICCTMACISSMVAGVWASWPFSVFVANVIPPV